MNSRLDKTGYRAGGEGMMLRYLGYGYLAIGAVLANVMWGSFVFPHVWTAPSIGGVISVQPVAVMSAGVRLVLWGPSLVAWYADPRGGSFGEWIAPGLHAEAEEQPQ